MLGWLMLAVAQGDPVDIPATEGLASYRIDRGEVSVSDFEGFVSAGGYLKRDFWSEQGWAWIQENKNGAGAQARLSGRKGDHPVVAVSFFEAEAYCRSKGGKLPSAAQWENAVCGSNGPYPWGEGTDREVSWFAEGKYGRVESVSTWPVHSGEANASPHGLLHGAGNVWEWTQANVGDWVVLRGGSFSNLPSYCTCKQVELAKPGESRLTAGFRCAWL